MSHYYIAQTCSRYHLQAAIVKENSVSRNIDLFRYDWIHLLPAIVKEDSISRQSSLDLFRYGWIHLQSAIVKKDSVSRQSSIDLFRYGWIHLQVSKVHSAIVKEAVSAINLVSQICRIYLQLYIDSLLLLLEQVGALQHRHFLPLQLVTMVCICSHPQNPAERHVQEAALQLPYCLFLQLATAESNSGFKQGAPPQLKRGTYSL